MVEDGTESLVRGILTLRSSSQLFPPLIIATGTLKDWGTRLAPSLYLSLLPSHQLASYQTIRWLFLSLLVTVDRLFQELVVISTYEV